MTGLFATISVVTGLALGVLTVGMACQYPAMAVLMVLVACYLVVVRWTVNDRRRAKERAEMYERVAAIGTRYAASAQPIARPAPSPHGPDALDDPGHDPLK